MLGQTTKSACAIPTNSNSIWLRNDSLLQTTRTSNTYLKLARNWRKTGSEIGWELIRCWPDAGSELRDTQPNLLETGAPCALGWLGRGLALPLAKSIRNLLDAAQSQENLFETGSKQTQTLAQLSQITRSCLGTGSTPRKTCSDIQRACSLEAAAAQQHNIEVGSMVLRTRHSLLEACSKQCKTHTNMSKLY